MKPAGLGFTINNGALGMRVYHPSSTEDKIWDAVEEAIDSGWNPERFKNECADAWRERLEQDAKDAANILSK